MCESGVQTCAEGLEDNPDICDGLDNDCNPDTADGSAESWLGAPCDGPDSDICPEGGYLCSSGNQTCSDLSGSTQENTYDGQTCNDGVDNDCDGSIDSEDMGCTELKRFTNSLGMNFVLIPPGSCLMGSPEEEYGRNVCEGPRHAVSITSGFYMQNTEVTQGQWRALMGNNPSYFSSCGDTCPVEWVSWEDAQAFVQALNEHEGTTAYRLPTEAEWEYAARGGNDTAFSNGGISLTQDCCEYDANLDAVAWYCDNSNDTTHPVAQKQPNAVGLYDMHGNVLEWCLDYYGAYSSDGGTNPLGPDTGTLKVLRGGSWYHWARHSRSAFRSYFWPEGHRNMVGFRVTRQLCVDSDGDGYYYGSDCTVASDCNDSNPKVHPGAPEICDGQDNDCNADTADGSAELWYGTACDGADSDLCAEGVYECTAGVQSCTDNDSEHDLDLCNGTTDDDCNAATADGSDEVWYASACDGADSDLCTEGIYECTSGVQSCTDNNSEHDLDLCNGTTNDDCNAASV